MKKETIVTLVAILGLGIMLSGCADTGTSENGNGENGTNSGGSQRTSALYFNNGEFFGELSSDNVTILNVDGVPTGTLEAGTGLVSDNNGIAIAVCESINGEVNFVDGVLVGECTLDRTRDAFYPEPPKNTSGSSSSSSTSSTSGSSSSNNGGLTQDEVDSLVWTTGDEL